MFLSPQFFFPSSSSVVDFFLANDLAGAFFTKKYLFLSGHFSLNSPWLV
jgi:hypothetical protein